MIHGKSVWDQRLSFLTPRLTGRGTPDTMHVIKPVFKVGLQSGKDSLYGAVTDGSRDI